MLEIFRKNIFINSLLLLPYIFLIRIGTLLMPQSYGTDEISGTYIHDYIFNNLENPLMMNIIAGILIFIQALIINHIFLNQKISRESTLFPGVFYVLFVSLIADTSGLTPILIANTFMLLALNNTLNTYKNIRAIPQIFNAGFMIAMASVFYIPYFIFILFGILSLLQLRSFKIREKLQFLIGAFTPYFLIFTLRYWYDLPFIGIEFLNDMFFRWPEISMDQPLIEYIAITLILILALSCFVFYGNIVAKKAIQSKKKIEILYWYMIFSLIAYLVFNTKLEEHILSLAIPISLLLGILSSESKNKIFFELLHFMLIVIIFISQFHLISF